MPPTSLRDRVEPEVLSALWDLCCSTDTAPLEKMIKTLEPTKEDLRPGLWYAIERGNFVMMRYLLDDFGMSVERHEIEEALRRKSIPVFEFLRDRGQGRWDDPNVNLGERLAHTALR